MTRYNHMTTLNYTGTVQTFTVPTTGRYSITAAGASGGQIDSTVSRGALVLKTYDLQANSKLIVIVGAQPKSTGTFRQSGGGGGSFVYRDSVSRENVLVVGGGGGGSAAFYLGSVMAGGNGLSEPGSGAGGTGADHGKHSGHPATPGSAGNNYSGGGGGGPIPSGAPPNAYCGVGGGGGGMGIGYAGASFSGGTSQSHTCYTQTLKGQDGGYGGGGASGIGWNYTGGGGGGGGYSGGNAGVGARLDSDAWPPGGNSGTGGGSFPSGAYIGTNAIGHGYVKIEFVSPSTPAPTSSPTPAATTQAPTTQAPTPAPTLAFASTAPTTTPSPSSAPMLPPAYLRYPPNFVILVHEGEWMNSGSLKVMTLRGSTPSLQPFAYKDLTQVFAIDGNGSVRTVAAQGEYLNHATNCDGVIGGSSASQWRFVPRNLPRSYALEVVCSNTLGTKRIDFNPVNNPWGPFLSASTAASTGWFIVPVARVEST